MMKKTAALLMILMLLTTASAVYADDSNSMKEDGFSTSYSYNYDYWGDVQMTPDPYRVLTVIDSSSLGLEQLDGVLVEGTKTGLPNPNIRLYQKLIDRGIPLVFMHGNYEQLPGTLSVLDDNIGGGRMLVEYLYNKGHRKIAGIFKYDDIQGRQRFIGYLDAMQEFGLSPEDKNILWYSTDQKENFLRDNADDMHAGEFFSACSAVVCYNDEIASRVVSYLNKTGISIPGDIAVVSFDNSQYSELSIPRITSLTHEPHNVGRMAAELLFRYIRGESCASKLAPWTLIEKESS